MLAVRQQRIATETEVFCHTEKASHAMPLIVYMIGRAMLSHPSHPMHVQNNSTVFKRGWRQGHEKVLLAVPAGGDVTALRQSIAGNATRARAGG